jgi:hypothetical protein
VYISFVIFVFYHRFYEPSTVPVVSPALSVNFPKKDELQGSLNTGNFGPAIEYPMQLLMKLLFHGTPEGVSDRPLVKWCLLAVFTMSRMPVMASWYNISQAVDRWQP